MIWITQLCRINQVYRQLARDAGLVALAAAHVPPYLSLVITASIQRVCSYAACVLLYQISRVSGPIAPYLTPDPEWCCVELSM